MAILASQAQLMEHTEVCNCAAFQPQAWGDSADSKLKAGCPRRDPFGEQAAPQLDEWLDAVSHAR